MKFGNKVAKLTYRSVCPYVVTGNFDKFIGRVRIILFQQSGDGSYDELDDKEVKDDANFQAVSFALSRLIQSVREFASGLALPEVGLDG